MTMPSSYRKAIADYIFREAKPIEKFGHQPRLYALAQRIGAAIPHDDDVLYAAAWLHDLGIFIGHRPEHPEQLATWDHVAYVMQRTPGILTDAQFPADKIPAVLEAIRTHQPHDEPAAIEGIILRDADILEQLGAIGILRTVCKVGRDTRFPTFTDAVDSLRKALANLPPRIKLEPTRQLAQPKIAALANFLEAVDNESYGFLL
jgi:uncharacterized protein